MLPLLKFRSTAPAVLVVVIAVLAVRLMGLAIGAVLGVRLPVVFSVPPDKLRVPVPSPNVAVVPTDRVPALIVVGPE
jgi:predicted lysophospholipase L1 biosynthesis ABC-type transport system permease subunit